MKCLSGPEKTPAFDASMVCSYTINMSDGKLKNNGFCVAVFVTFAAVGHGCAHTLRCHFLAAAFVISSLAHPALGFGDSWDVTTDFSVENGNPNGAWSYGWMDVGLTTFSASSQHDDYGPEASPVWISGWIVHLAHSVSGSLWKNRGGPQFGVGPGQISLHPGFGFEASVARWTAPLHVSGTANIRGTFFPGDPGIMAVAVRINGTERWSAVDSGAFDLTSVVEPGDTIDFAVYNGYTAGNTPLAGRG